MTKKYTTKQLAEDLYDLIKVNALRDSQDGYWAALNRGHAEDAKKNIHKFVKDKSMEWCGNNVIKIGKHITITVEDNRSQK